MFGFFRYLCGCVGDDAMGAVERDFATELDISDDVCVYAKLPRAFQIPTPVGNYAPDWAIAFKKGSVKHIFFAAETKGAMASMIFDGPRFDPIEAKKTVCAKKLFNEVSTSEVRYAAVSSYDDLIKKMSGIEGLGFRGFEEYCDEVE